MESFAAFFLATLVAQAPAPAGSLGGAVLDSRTGEPLPGVEVVLNVNQATATSDAAGRFDFVGLSAGEYRLGATRPGFAKMDIFTGPSVRLSNGERARDIIIRLAPEAVLSGRVVDENGKPVEASVSLQGAERPAALGFVMTKGGEFTLRGLSANDYLLEAKANEPAYSSSTYYPSEARRERAARITLREGEHRSDLVVVVKSRRLFKVRGQFLGELLAHGSQSVVPDLVPREQSMRMRTSRLDPERRFVVEIPAGNYRLKVQSWPQTPKRSQPFVMGFANVTVTDHDLEDVVVPASPLYTVRVRQRWAEAKRQDPIQTEVSLNPLEGLGILQTGKAGPDGTIAVANVSPDRYAIFVSRIPGAYVESIWAGDTDITRRGLDLLNASVADVEVRFASGAAQVSGQMRDAAGQPAPGAFVYFRALSADRTNGQDVWSASASCDAQGRYLADSLAPGDYQVTARLSNRTLRPQTLHVERSEKLVLDLVLP
ncbi:MAG: carboxypeptidase regulatory-like domain-containing protein [Bryobacteraceae bacterium]|nr:carboxypeptidase regulatory-like domain-containing protein [Bryobacteraceae bacterium]